MADGDSMKHPDPDRDWVPYFVLLDEKPAEGEYRRFEVGYLDLMGSRFIVGVVDVVGIQLATHVEGTETGLVVAFTKPHRSLVWEHHGLLATGKSDAVLRYGEITFNVEYES